MLFIYFTRNHQDLQQQSTVFNHLKWHHCPTRRKFLENISCMYLVQISSSIYPADPFSFNWLELSHHLGILCKMYILRPNFRAVSWKVLLLDYRKCSFSPAFIFECSDRLSVMSLKKGQFSTTLCHQVLPLFSSWQDFDFAVGHWFGCRATESGFAGDIGAIEVWLIDWYSSSSENFDGVNISLYLRMSGTRWKFQLGLQNSKRLIFF